LTGFVAQAQDWPSVLRDRRAGIARDRVSHERLREKHSDFRPVFDKFAETGMCRGRAARNGIAMASRLL
jgi:hypothetical protein